MNKKFNNSDNVAVLNDSFSGTVKGYKGQKVLIETTEGFILEFDEAELIKVTNTAELKTMMALKGFSEGYAKDKEQPKKRSFVKEKKQKGSEVVLETDLHIEKLVKNKKGMSNYDILTLQTETAIRQIEFAIKNRIPKVVLIHGVGEGILKAELDFILGRYENIVFRDADYQKYGLGATEVYIKQNSSR